MPEIPRISDAEWDVMQVLWESTDVLTAGQIIQSLAEKHQWKPKTIQTLIGRLVNKKVIGFKENGRVYQYYPLIKREDCLRAESDSFLQKVFGGAVKPMFLHFLQEHKLSPEEIEELERILGGRKE